MEKEHDDSAAHAWKLQGPRSHQSRWRPPAAGCIVPKPDSFGQFLVRGCGAHVLRAGSSFVPSSEACATPQFTCRRPLAPSAKVLLVPKRQRAGAVQSSPKPCGLVEPIHGWLRCLGRRGMGRSNRLDRLGVRDYRQCCRAKWQLAQSSYENAAIDQFGIGRRVGGVLGQGSGRSGIFPAIDKYAE